MTLLNDLLDGMVGMVVATARPSTSLPAGWLFCNGAAVSRTTYANLFTAIGTTYGAGDGSTTFNLPDYRGRVLAGRDDMGGTAANRLQVSTTITTTAGSATATVGSATGLAVGMQVIASTVPAGVTIAAISGTTVTLSSGTSVTAGTATAARFSVVSDPQSVAGAGGSHAHTLIPAQLAAHAHAMASVANRNTTAGGSDNVSLAGGGNTANTNNTGGDQPHPNVQPTAMINYLIKF